MQREARGMGWEVIKSSFIHLAVLAIFIGGYVYYRMSIAIRLTEDQQTAYGKYISTAFIIVICAVVQGITKGMLSWYGKEVAAKTATRLDDELLPIVRRAIGVLVWVIAALIILPLYGVNINSLIAVLGVSSLAIALAAQDTIANIISGFMIMIDRPFRVGDKIKLPTGEVVRVLKIGVRRSRFLSEDKAILIAPNSDLSKSKIINYTYGEERGQ